MKSEINYYKNTVKPTHRFKPLLASKQQREKNRTNINGSTNYLEIENVSVKMCYSVVMFSVLRKFENKTKIYLRWFILTPSDWKWQY